MTGQAKRRRPAILQQQCRLAPDTCSSRWQAAQSSTRGFRVVGNGIGSTTLKPADQLFTNRSFTSPRQQSHYIALKRAEYVGTPYTDIASETTTQPIATAARMPGHQEHRPCDH